MTPQFSIWSVRYYTRFTAEVTFSVTDIAVTSL